ncbi:hypothetical protein ACRAVF_33770 (plasmid) [Bradyrhizobium oligotrophicum S58]
MTSSNVGVLTAGSHPVVICAAEPRTQVTVWWGDLLIEASPIRMPNPTTNRTVCTIFKGMLETIRNLVRHL